MRLALALAFSLAATSATQAQIQPITPPKNPYALPQPPGAPRMSEPGAFQPYKPPAYLNPALPSSAADPYPHMRRTPGVPRPVAPATAADPYPSLRKRKHSQADGYF
jgi:hypothetical protein